LCGPAAAEGSADPLARAIAAGALPLLEELELWGCGMGVEAARGLVEGFTAGVAPELRKAEFFLCSLEDSTVQDLRAAIVEGCPRVRKNHLRIFG
jgi:hypothetical protein